MAIKNWKPVRANAILKNLAKVLKEGDINHLTLESYKQLSIMSGFIAHTNFEGFKDHYAFVGELVLDLIASHDVRNPDRYSTDPWFAEHYGVLYAESKATLYRGIRDLVKHGYELANEFNDFKVNKKCDECGTLYSSNDDIEYLQGNNQVCQDCN